MVHPLRLVALWALCWLAAVFFPVPAFAYDQTEYCTSAEQGGTCGQYLGWFTTKAAACTARENNTLAFNPGGGIRHDSSDPTCRYCASGGAAPNYCFTGNPLPNANREYGYGTRVVVAQCQAPLVEVNGQCVDPCMATNGESSGSQDVFKGGTKDGGIPGGLGEFSWCSPNGGSTLGHGCKATGDPSLGYWSDTGAQGPGWYARVTGTLTGVSCTPAASVPAADGTGGTGEPSTCPDGYVLGQINGVDSCQPAGSGGNPTATDSTSSGTKTSSMPDGTTSTTSDNKTTSCVGSTCSTTTTSSVTANGTTTTTVTTGTSDKASYCRDNPQDPACKEAGSFGGACGGTFSCTGDGIECAIALATNKLQCAFVPAPAELAPYQSALAAGTATGVQNTVRDVNSGLFDQSNALGVAPGGMEDITVVVAGTSVVLPFSKVNPYLEILGQILVGISFLLAVRIVTRG